MLFARAMPIGSSAAAATRTASRTRAVSSTNMFTAIEAIGTSLRRTQWYSDTAAIGTSTVLATTYRISVTAASVGVTGSGSADSRNRCGPMTGSNTAQL